MQRHMGVVRIAGVSALLVSLALPAMVRAQPLPSDRANVRFDSTVRVPGLTLEPGEYLFVLGMPVGGQAVIDIYRAKDSRLMASCLVVESRQRRPGWTTITEYEGTDPPALRAWFHPGNAVGFEFVYGVGEAKAIYLSTGESVPFAAVTRVSPEQLGTIPIAVSGSQDAESPAPIGTAGSIRPPALGPVDHLEAARAALASRLSAADAGTLGRLVLIVKLLEGLEAAYRSGRDGDARRDLRTVRNTVDGMLVGSRARFSGLRPLDPETEAALERVRAHLAAFASFLQ